jgi:hypothetical protein
MLEELSLAGNRVLKFSISEELITALAEQAELQLAAKSEISQNYDPESWGTSYMFRSPAKLDGTFNGVGYQWENDSTTDSRKLQGLIVKEMYEATGSMYTFSDSWYLLQTDSPDIDNPMHQHLTSDWSAVTYVKVNDGDSVQFADDAGNTEDFYPEAGDVIIFPSMAWHKPNRNAGTGHRISLNMSLDSAEQVDQEMVDSRLAICSGCPLFTADRTCTECSCAMDLKTKIHDAFCPLGKW